MSSWFHQAFTADRRGISTMRVLISLQYIVEVVYFWIPEMWGEDGLLSEELYPLHEIPEGKCESVYCISTNPFMKTAIAILHVLFLISLTRKHSSIMALLVFAMQVSLHNRNLWAAGRETRMNKTFLALALIDNNNDHQIKMSSGRKMKTRKWDGGVALMFVSFITMWCTHGISKWMEWSHWWLHGDAVLLSMYSDEAYSFTRSLADWMLHNLPYSISMLICRAIVLLEFPLGLLLILSPWESIRTFGFGMIFAVLFMFSVLLNVGMFPCTCAFMALPFVPSGVWDSLELFQFWITNAVSSSMVKTKSTYPRQTVPQKILSMAKLMLGITAAIIVALHTGTLCIRMKSTETMQGFKYLISGHWDKQIEKLGDRFHLNGGWMAFTPPPNSRDWFVAEGYAAAEDDSEIRDGMRGILVSYYSGINDTKTNKAREGGPFLDQIFASPPFQCLADVPYWSSQVRRVYEGLVVYYPGAQVAPLKARLLRRICRDYHKRYNSPHQRLGHIKLWGVQQQYSIKFTRDESHKIVASFHLGPISLTSDQALLSGVCQVTITNGSEIETALLFDQSGNIIPESKHNESFWVV